MPEEIDGTSLSPGEAEQPFQTQKEKLKEITDGIEKGIKDLFASGEYAQYLKTMSRFHSYSLNNIILIFMQRPHATMVAGFSKWKDQFDRHVNKGEKGIKIIAPVLYNKKVEREKRDPQTQMIMVDEQGEPIMEEITIRVPRFKVTSVFDVSQTVGKPLPTLVHDLHGNVDNYNVFMEAIRRTSPVPMDVIPMSQEEHGDGYYSLTERHTYIRAGMSETQTISAALHEMAHAMLHSREAIETEKQQNPEAKPKSRAQKEIEAESVSYACCQYFGIETKENSFGYIVNWSKDQELSELKASLETINHTADTIITGIDRNLKEILHEREAQQEKSQAKEEPTEIKTQPDTPWLSTSISITPVGLLTPDCGVEITSDALKAAGCDANGLLPLTKDKAFDLFNQAATIFALYPGDAVMLMNKDEIIKADCTFYGVEYDDWITTTDYQQRLSNHMEETAQLEQTFLKDMKEPAALIYQLMPDENLRDHLFMPMDHLQAQGLSVERQNYEPLYAMTMPTTETGPEKLLEGTFHMFNMNRPEDFKGHSMSVSDIIALKINGAVSFRYVDSFGFHKLDGFLPDNPLKNAEMTVEDDYGMIDGIINNGKNPALEPPRQEEQRTGPEASAQKDSLHKQEFPSILDRLNSPSPARTSPKKDTLNKNKGMEM